MIPEMKILHSGVRLLMLVATSFNSTPICRGLLEVFMRSFMLQCRMIKSGFFEMLVSI